MPSWDNPLITIISEKCRACYACVRECPAKAIKVENGQASVVQPRCIGCGNCLRVCTQKARQVRDDTRKAFALLESGGPVAAMLAPSSPAEFTDISRGALVAMLRALGFSSVHEVTLGADLVGRRYKALLEEDPERRYITTACAAVVSYVRKYEPQLMPYLAPVVSPMVAMARVLRHDMGQDLKTVFIGPCVAKKAASINVIHREIDAVLTFAEIRAMLTERGLLPQDYEGSDDRFDPPYGGVGAVFPIPGGLLQTAGLKRDLLSGELIIAEGKAEFVETLHEFDLTHADVRLLDVLACQGCFEGAGTTSKETMLQRRTRVSKYAKSRLADFSGGELAEIERAGERYSDVSLYQAFASDYQPVAESATEEDIQEILHRMGKDKPEDHLNCGACGYGTCLAHARAVYEGLAGSEMCLPRTIEQLRTAYDELETSHRSLEEAQEALERSTKLASMGQLAAGVAHEVNNPLSTLLLHANLLLEECRSDDTQTRRDLETIIDQANRCRHIISGLLNFARQSRVMRRPTDVTQLVEKVLKTTIIDRGVEVEVDDTLVDPVAELDAGQMIQVLTNLLTNAQHAMSGGGTLHISLSDTPREVTIRVSDTGQGIPKDHLDKVFDPFFTTKQVGMGTGLGLSVTHGIIKMHRGTITVGSNADPRVGPTWTAFTLVLPRREAEQAEPSPDAEGGGG